MDAFSGDSKLFIGMVGLPARGKTYISRKLQRYLTWLGIKSRAFNIANYRRVTVGSEVPLEFFDESNKEASEKRNKCAAEALEDLIKFLNEEKGNVTIFDATNTTKQRRMWVKDELTVRVKKISILWIESICTNEKMIEKNIKQAKTNNPDYIGSTPEEATEYFKKKCESLNKYYQTLDSDEYEGISYIKLFNAGKELNVHHVEGYLPSKILSFIINLQLYPRPIYMTRHGESLFNTEDRVGGDSDLSEKGYKYTKHLPNFFKKEFEKLLEEKASSSHENVKIFTSTMVRAKNTANSINLGVNPIYLKILDEINVGVCDGLTYTEISSLYPMDAKERQDDKLRYRYKRGESYIDLINRIEPIIFEIERSKQPVIVVGHQAVLRCLYAYFTIHDIDDIPHLDMPLHTIIKLEPETYFCREKRYLINIETGSIEEKEIQKAILLPPESVKIF